MKRYLIPVWVVGLAAVLVLTTGACGGGDGDTPIDPLTLFAGTYCAVGFSGDDGAPDEGAAQWGDFISSGAGTLTGGSLTENENGVLSGPTPNPALTYTVDASRVLTLNFGGTPLLRGGVSADGKLAGLATVLAGSTPGFFLMGRKGETFSTASLSGDYHLCSFLYFHVPLEDRTFYAGTATFDGAGNSITTSSVNIQGTIGPLPPIAGTYSVAADGTFTGDLLPSLQTLEGTVLLGGSLILLAGGTAAGQPPAVHVLIRKTAGASNATFSGTYFAIGITADNVPGDVWLSTTTTVNADGAGMVTIGPFTTNADGTVTSFPAVGIPGPYAVAPDGALDISTGGFLGGVSASGNVAMFAGGTMGGDSPEFWFLMR